MRLNSIISRLVLISCLTGSAAFTIGECRAGRIVVETAQPLQFTYFFSRFRNVVSKPPSQVALHNFEKWRPRLQKNKNFNVVEAGGWYALQTLSENPKKALVDYIMDQPKELDGYIQEGHMDHGPNPPNLHALCALLEAQGKGYDSDLVDGEWNSVLSKQGKKSPRIQKLVGMADSPEKRATTFANFDVKEGKFRGNFKILGKGDLQSTVKVRLRRDGLFFDLYRLTPVLFPPILLVCSRFRQFRCHGWKDCFEAHFL